MTKSFGGLVAVKNVNFYVKEGEILGLIGPNGAGKTTLFNLISGIYHPDSGTIKFKEEDITKLKPHEICQRGIGRTFQIVRPFRGMTVLNNVLIGSFFGSKSKNMDKAKKQALEALELVKLSDKKDVNAENLTIAECRRMEIARALATNPSLLLLDEVVAGLNPLEVEEMMRMIQEIRRRGITIIMVEHVMKAVMNVSDRIIVMHHGEKIAEGSPSEVSKNEKVVKAYLGERRKTFA